MTKRDEPSILVDREILDPLETLAERENIPASALAKRILRDHLVDQGLIEPASEQKALSRAVTDLDG